MLSKCIDSGYSFPPIVLKLFRCFLHGMKMCMCFGYNPLIIFFSLFLLCELSLFSVWNAIKVYRQWIHCGCNSSYSSPFSPLIFCQNLSKSSNFYYPCHRFLRRRYRGIDKLISMLHVLISGQHWNNWATESNEKLNEIQHTCWTNFQAHIVHFVILIANKTKQLLSLNQEIGYYKKTLQ